MAVLAGAVGALIAGLGVLGLMDPPYFIGVVSYFQAAEMLYAAAAIRLVLGVALIVCARASRWPNFLRLLGGIIFIGGLITPFEGAWLGRTLLDLWPSWGPGVVRGWGTLATVLGVLIVYSVIARPKLVAAT